MYKKYIRMSALTAVYAVRPRHTAKWLSSWLGVAVITAKGYLRDGIPDHRMRYLAARLDAELAAKIDELERTRAELRRGWFHEATLATASISDRPGNRDDRGAAIAPRAVDQSEGSAR